MIVPECIHCTMETCDGGSRNNTLFDAVCFVKTINKNISIQDLKEAALDINGHFKEPLPEEEVENVVRSVNTHGYPGGHKPFKQECMGWKNCPIYGSGKRKPVDFLTVDFPDGMDNIFVSAWVRERDYMFRIYRRDSQGRVEKPLSDEIITTKDPAELMNAKLGKSILSILKEHFAEKVAKTKTLEILDSIEKTIKDYKFKLEELEHEKRAKEYEREVERLKTGKEFLSKVDKPIEYLGTVIDWLVAGERQTAMFAYFSHLSTLIYNKPINVLLVGDSSEGKSEVLRASLDLVPRKHISREKNPTMASMFHRSSEDPYHYDKKVVDYGDLGGSNDLENSESPRNIIKELNSEGYVNRPIAEKGRDGTFETINLELFGKPSIVYTTVHDEVDEQEMSRGFIFAPRTDNKKMVTTLIQAKRDGGRTWKEMEFIRKSRLPEIHAMVEYLIENGDKIKVVNPYKFIIEQWIIDAPFVKRDFEKLLIICEIITILNKEKRDKVEHDGFTYIISQPEDVVYLGQMLEKYMTSLNKGLKQRDIDFLRKLSDKFGDAVFTRPEIQSKLAIKTHREALRRQLVRLKDAGYIDGVTEQGQPTEWSIITTDFEIDLSVDSWEIPEWVQKNLLYELPDVINAGHLVTKTPEDVDILEFHDYKGTLKPAPWEYMEPKRETKERKFRNI